jgi:Fe-S-cluster-containing hydrogenase component 2
VCKEERCQVNAVEEEEDNFRIIAEKCIGCGLCVTDCSVECIRLVRRPEDQIIHPPRDIMQWADERARLRGVSYDSLK